MEVILAKDIEDLGKAGSIVKVKDGYARNKLLPQNLAYLTTPENLKRIAKLEKSRKDQYEEDKHKAEALAKEIEKLSPTIDVQVNDAEKLYGSVSNTEIAKALDLLGYSVDKKNIFVEKPIEDLGIFEIKVKLHPEVLAKVRLWVTKK